MLIIMDFVNGIDRDQLVMMDFEANVAVDSWARIVDLFVDMLPLEELGFKDVLNSEGRPPYRSSDMLKLFMYGYKKKMRSSYALEEACKINLEVIWLMRGLRPSARKIAYFRKDNPKAFKEAFRYFVRILKDMDLISGETIAIDSFKIRAQNSLKNNYNQNKIDRQIEYIDDKIDEFEKALNSEDLGDEEKEEIEQKKALQQQRRKEYKAIEKELNDSGESQISKTDPDAKSVILHRNVVNVGYNIQAGCDRKYKLFINNDTGSVNDTNALADMALDAKALLGVDKMNTLTDKGYTTGKQINICTKNNITTYSSPKAHSSKHNGLYSMEIFVYDKANDTYTCPGGAEMKGNNIIYKKRNHRVRRYTTKNCQGCELREKCTTNKRGRIIERSIYQEAIEANAKRVNENPEYYRLRQQITEHQFGTLKRHWGFIYTLMKGKENVLSEVNLMMMVYNLRRLMSIFDINELKSRLKSLVYQLFEIFGSKWSFLSPFIFRIKNKVMNFFVNLKLAKRLILAFN